jgi:hypothetical protein
MFVNWKVGQVGKNGQEVKDDSDGYVIYPMAEHYPFRTFDSIHILCPSLGVRIKKASSDAGRAKFPPFAIRLRNMYAALNNVDGFPMCRACGKAHAPIQHQGSSSSSASDVSSAVEATKVFTCSICLIPFHRSCADFFLQRCMANNVLSKSEVVAPTEFLHSSASCPLCIEAMRGT